MNILTIEDIGKDFIYIENIINSLENLDHNNKNNIETIKYFNNILLNLKDTGYEYEYKGSWYPNVLILDYEFQDYISDIAESTISLSKESLWILRYINWENVAYDAKMNSYSSIILKDSNNYEYTYWYLYK